MCRERLHGFHGAYTVVILIIFTRGTTIHVDEIKPYNYRKIGTY
jgi:hypothetical protein